MRQRLTDLVERARAHRVLGPVIRFIEELATAFRIDRVTGLAAEIAYFAFLSLFPLLLVFASTLGFLDRIIGDDLADRAENVVVEVLEDTLTEEGSGVIDSIQDLFDEPAPGLLSLGIILTLWAASRGFAAVTNALDVVYDFHDRRGWVQTRAIGLAMTVGTVLAVALLLAMLLVGPLFGTGRDLADELGMDGGFVTVWTWLRGPVVFVVMVVWAATIYHVAPSGHSPWRFDLPGALLASVGWVAVTVGFRFYVETTATESAAGTVGGVLVAVLWMYLMGIVLLVGGEVNAIIEGRRPDVRADAPDDSDGSGDADPDGPTGVTTAAEDGGHAAPDDANVTDASGATPRP